MTSAQEYKVSWYRAEHHAHYGTYESGPYVHYVTGTSAADVRSRMRAAAIVSRVLSVRATEVEYAGRISRAERSRNR